ncbi:MAG: NADPH-dependent F420 reductase [Bacteroidota bacterium]
MNVTIIGAGNMGRAIGTRAAAAGHSVTFVDHDPKNAEAAVAEVSKSARSGTQISGASLDNVKLGDIVILALWYGTNMQVARQLGSKLAGKVVVDIANPVNSTYDDLATAPGSSSAEEVAQAAAPGARVVKAFNTTYAGTLREGEVEGQPLDVFIAGDDAAAKELVAQLVTDAGLRPVDTGPLSRARQIEAMQLVHMIAQGTLGTNWGSTIKILS